MVNPTRKKGAGIEFVLPPVRGGAAGEGGTHEGGLADLPAVPGSRPEPGAAGLTSGVPVSLPGEPGAAAGAGGQMAGAAADGVGAPGSPAMLVSVKSGAAQGSVQGSAQGATAGRPAGEPAPGAPWGERSRGRTGVGLLAETVFESQRLERQIAELNSRVEQLTGERGAQAMDPRWIAPSRWANRHPDAFAGPEFEQLKAEIQDAGGNVQPIKIRPMPEGRADGTVRYEIVFGHRRHRACLELGLPVLVVVQDLNDAALFVQMERENRGRENLSAWEQGRMYLRAIEEGLFPSNVKLAAAIGRDPSDIGKAVRAAKLPQEITQAFVSPTSIQFRWVAELERALKEHGAQVLARARELGQQVPRPASADVYNALTSVLRGQGVGPSQGVGRDIDAGGHGQVTIHQDRKGRTVVEFPAGAMPQDKWPALESALRKLLG